jgi:hypothetical protein
MKQTYDRRAIMREAGRLMRETGLKRPDAMRAAWAAAKAPRYAKQQEGGLRAALRRYGIDPDRVAERARAAALAIVVAIDTRRPALLPPPSAKALDMTRGTDGVYRL